MVRNLKLKTMINMRQFLVIIVTVITIYSCNENYKNRSRLTGINTLSYTDVEYIGIRDSAIVSTYSGRIGKIINGIEKEELFAQIDDEIYSLAYSKERNEIMASTMDSGILVLNATNGKIIKKLKTGASWINDISISSDGKYLMGFNGHHENFVWDVTKNYKPIDYPKDFPNAVVRLGKENIIYHTGGGKLILWYPETGQVKVTKSERGKLVDVNSNGDLLYLNHDELIICTLKDTIRITIKKKHPDWPYYLASRDSIFRIPLQMKLTTAQITKNTVFTGGIDRSIRYWDVATGHLKDELLKHGATISSIKISKDLSQMVSVDLKGGIHYTNLQ
ncbi:hypothetical protein JL193_01870 [Polaribacter batillariae]|uniref:WD40 repeat domain-containing protein n=1 Tax=Polaribacter batillariae TaxID=2808900 RepID=A0ABX7SV05_9FLAO|nr:hypothetical protein [Polaribacter batillariae]QTD38077.1 hypothetical protein JL193_01870 [Polaribacter batillariae]